VSKLTIYVLGAGKLGRNLAKALAAKGARVTLRPARKGLPKKRIDADFVVLAVRDRDITPLAQKLADAHLVSKKSVCVHVAGALDAEPLAPLRAVSAGVAQMHPMISFASPRSLPSLARGQVHVQGDRAAVARATKLARLLGMTPRTIPRLDTVGYHAAAGLVANGAAALGALGAELLVKSGVAREVAPKMLGPLLRSVADNVESLGFPDALTGPVRRGELAGLRRHIETLQTKLPEAVPLYVASAAAQLPLARALGDAPKEAFDEIERFLTGISR
jgi:predicted short-subunit dehydrogenase-like oxidoreductase (DUF2520 family)